MDAYVHGGRESLVDPYTGEPLRYRQDESYPRGVRMASSGPDGLPETDDDFYLDADTVLGILSGFADSVVRRAAYAVELFREEHGRLPSVEEFHSSTVGDYVGGDLRGFTDPFSGDPILYRQDETYSRGYSITSLGPDGVARTKDDICWADIYASTDLDEKVSSALGDSAWAARQFRREHGRLPSIEELYSPSVGAEIDPYTWGRLRYWRDDACFLGFRLASAGPDSVAGTADDIHFEYKYPPGEGREVTLWVLRRAASGVERFQEEHGRLPSVAEFSSPEVCGYLVDGKDALRDPFSKGRIRYWQDESHPRGYRLASAGADSVPGTYTDIYLTDALEP